MTPAERAEQVAKLVDANTRLLIAMDRLKNAECDAERQAAKMDIQHAQAAMAVHSEGVLK